MVAIAVDFRVYFRSTRGVSGIHMSEDYCGLVGSTGLKLDRMKETVSMLSSMYVHQSACLSVYEVWVKVQVSGHCYWKCHSFINTGGLLGSKGVMGVINNTAKFYKALKWLTCIFAVKCIYLIYTHFWPFIW